MLPSADLWFGCKFLFTGMLDEIVLNNRSMNSGEYSERSEQDLFQAQQVIFSYLIGIVKSWSAVDVLAEFRHLFIEHNATVSSDAIAALQIILFSNNEEEFRNTLKRSCYILVNNWEVMRQYDAIGDLVQIFHDPILERKTFSPTLRRLRFWLANFINGSDFKELELFAARFAEASSINRPDQWSTRYAHYLLVPQYINSQNPIEQRQAARALAKRLKDKFKFDLAMYTAHSQGTVAGAHSPSNPTVLGDSALRLIKAIVAKRGNFSYKSLANIFLQQTNRLSYAEFKRSLVEYLLFSIKQQPITENIRSQIRTKLDLLYIDQDSDQVDRSLILRTCNRIIDYLMTEDQCHPSSLFSLILSQGNSLTLAIVLLKVILVSRGSLAYLEARIAELIQYYEQFPPDQCTWVINFLEVFRVTFAIYAENVEYNLVRVKTSDPLDYTLDSESQETFRIFSQMTSWGTDNDFGDDLEELE
jgi:hypothetical protein